MFLHREDTIKAPHGEKYLKKRSESFWLSVKVLIFAPLLRKARAFSSAGSEHLPYKQRVGGSNPSTPTKKGVLVEAPFFVGVADSLSFFYFANAKAPPMGAWRPSGTAVSLVASFAPIRFLPA